MKRTSILSVLLASGMVLSSLIILFSAFAAAPSSSARDAYGTAPTREPPLRNVAFRRAVWHSSAANYDNTGQLIADGIIGVLSSEILDYSGTSVSNPTHGQMVPGRVNSEWISASGSKEWVYLDLGAMTALRSINVHWGTNYAVAYDIQVSTDAKTWETVASAAGVGNSAVDTKIETRESRYLRILCNTSSGANYIIREVEVMGTNNVAYKLAAQPAPEADGSQRLTGGNWTIQRASLVAADGKILSQTGYDDSAWLPATVPGTAFVSYLNAGAVPDPYYDDWQFQASDIFFTANFWYRTSFDIPATQQGKKVFLNFDAINWKADVWFNGQLLANTLQGYANSIEGAFIRAKFDVSALANYGGQNYLAVLIHRNKTPGLVTTQGLAEGPLPNGGEIGQDNPAIHAAVGWDWLPTIRGRNIGIYNDVTVTYGGGYAIAAMPNRNNGTGIKEYFDEVPYVTLRSECGIPNVPSLESMKKFLPEEKLWPINESWALHDWTYHMNGPANTYMDALQLYKPGAFTVPTDNVQGQKPDPVDPVFIRYKKDILEMVEAAGRTYTLEEFHKIAQLINYENFKGVYEGLTVKRSNGFLMWMSQSSWPSFMWQTYDWYLDTNAGYFGSKAANQATHAVWDPRNDAIVLSNMTPETYNDVTTNMKVFDLDGNVVSEQTWHTQTLGPDAYGIQLATATADFARSPTDLVFIRLTVKNGSGNVLGDTLYWHNWKDYMQYESLNRLPEVSIHSSVSPKSTITGQIGQGNNLYTITLSNKSSVPAVQTRIRTISSATDEDILPAFYSDNYFSLMPGESKTVTVEFNPKYLKGDHPVFELSGWNTKVETINHMETR